MPWSVLSTRKPAGRSTPGIVWSWLLQWLSVTTSNYNILHIGADGRPTPRWYTLHECHCPNSPVVVCLFSRWHCMSVLVRWRAGCTRSLVVLHSGTGSYYAPCEDVNHAYIYPHSGIGIWIDPTNQSPIWFPNSIPRTVFPSLYLASQSHTHTHMATTSKY